MKGTMKKFISVVLALAMVVTGLQFSPKTTVSAAEFSVTSAGRVYTLDVTGTDGLTSFVFQGAFDSQRFGMAWQNQVTFAINVYSGEELVLTPYASTTAGGANIYVNTLNTLGNGSYTLKFEDGENVYLVATLTIATEVTEPFVEGAEILKNTSFTNATNWNEYSNAGASFTNSGTGSVAVSVPGYTTGDNWSTQLTQENLQLDTNKYYVVKYKITSDVSRKFQVIIQTTDNALFDVNEIISVEAGETTEYVTIFQPTSANAYRYGIMMGYVDEASDAANVTISEPSLKAYSTRALAEASTEAESASEEESEETSEETSEPAETTPAAPTMVGNPLIEMVNNDTQIRVAGLDAITGATSYNLYVDGTLFRAVTNGEVILIDGNFSSGRHLFQVTGVNATGESEKSTGHYIVIPGGEQTEVVPYDDGIKTIVIQAGENPEANLITDTTKTKVTSSFKIYDEEGQLISEQTGKANTRGNSTLGADKKAYNIKFDSAYELVDNAGAAKKWSLLANAFDKTMVRNKLAMDLALEMGLSDCSHSEYVNVYVNGQFLGCYLAIEPVEVGANRVNIQSEYRDTTDMLLELEGLGDGNGKDESADGIRYIFSKDLANTDGDNRVRFAVGSPETAADGKDTNGASLPFTAEELAAKDATAVTMLNAVVDAIDSNDFDEISEVIDVNSFVSFYIVNELFKNKDFSYSSTRFYFKNGKLYAGPLWDLDLSSGNASGANNAGGASTNDFYCQNMPWFAALMKNPEFKSLVETKFTSELNDIKALYSGNGNEIDSLVGTNGSVRDAIDRNYSTAADGAGWSVTRLEGGDGWSLQVDQANVPQTYDAHLTYLKTWLGNRVSFLTEMWTDITEVDQTTLDPSQIDDWTSTAIDGADVNEDNRLQTYQMSAAVKTSYTSSEPKVISSQTFSSKGDAPYIQKTESYATDYNTLADYVYTIITPKETGGKTTSVVVDGVKYRSGTENMLVQNDRIYLNQDIFALAANQDSHIFKVTIKGEEEHTFALKVTSFGVDQSGITLPELNDENWVPFTNNNGNSTNKSVNGNLFYVLDGFFENNTTNQTQNYGLFDKAQDAQEAGWGHAFTDRTVPVVAWIMGNPNNIRALTIDGVTYKADETQNLVSTGDVAWIAQSLFDIGTQQSHIFKVTVSFTNERNDLEFPLKVVEDPDKYKVTGVAATDVTDSGALFTWNTISYLPADYSYQVVVDDTPVATSTTGTYQYAADLSAGTTHTLVIKTLDDEGNVVDSSDTVEFHYVIQTWKNFPGNSTDSSGNKYKYLEGYEDYDKLFQNAAYFHIVDGKFHVVMKENQVTAMTGISTVTISDGTTSTAYPTSNTDDSLAKTDGGDQLYIDLSLLSLPQGVDEKVYTISETGRVNGVETTWTYKIKVARPQLPNLTVTDVEVDGTVEPGAQVTVRVYVQNTGAEDLTVTGHDGGQGSQVTGYGNNPSNIYTNIFIRPAGAAAGWTEMGWGGLRLQENVLEAGETAAVQYTITLPATIEGMEIGAWTDKNGIYEETLENDNQLFVPLIPSVTIPNPSNVVASASSDKTVTLTWDAAQIDEDDDTDYVYKVYEGETLLGTTAAGVTTFTTSALANGIHAFTVKTVVDAKESDGSSTKALIYDTPQDSTWVWNEMFAGDPGNNKDNLGGKYYIAQNVLDYSDLFKNKDYLRVVNTGEFSNAGAFHFVIQSEGNKIKSVTVDGHTYTAADTGFVRFANDQVYINQTILAQAEGNTKVFPIILSGDADHAFLLKVEHKAQKKTMDWVTIFDETDSTIDSVFNLNGGHGKIQYKIVDASNDVKLDYDEIFTIYRGYGGYPLEPVNPGDFYGRFFMAIRSNASDYQLIRNGTGGATTKISYGIVKSLDNIGSATLVPLHVNNVDIVDENGNVVLEQSPTSLEYNAGENGFNWNVASWGLYQYNVIKIEQLDGSYVTAVFRTSDEDGQWLSWVPSGDTDLNFHYHSEAAVTPGRLYFRRDDEGWLAAMSGYNGDYIRLTCTDEMPMTDDYKIEIARVTEVDEDENAVTVGEFTEEPGYLRVSGTDIQLNVGALFGDFPLHSDKVNQRDTQYLMMRFYPNGTEKYYEIPLKIVAEVPEIEPVQNASGTISKDENDNEMYAISWGATDTQNARGYTYEVHVAGIDDPVPGATEAGKTYVLPSAYAAAVNNHAKVEIVAKWCEQETSTEVTFVKDEDTGWRNLSGDYSLSFKAGQSDERSANVLGTVKFYKQLASENHVYNVSGYNGGYVSISANSNWANTTTQVWVSEPVATENALSSVTYTQVADGNIEKLSGLLNIQISNVFRATHQNTFYAIKLVVDGHDDAIIKFQTETVPGDAEVKGYQMNTNTSEGAVSEFAPSFRVVSRTANVIAMDNETNPAISPVVSYGTLYGVANDITVDLAFETNQGALVESEGRYVTPENVYYQDCAPGINWSGSAEDDDRDSYTYYAVTFKPTAYTFDFLKRNYSVRSYAITAEGTVVYSGDANTTCLYDIAHELYENSMMPSEKAHQFLYDNVLNVVAIENNRANMVAPLVQELKLTSASDPLYANVVKLYEDMYYYARIGGPYKGTKYYERGAFTSLSKVNGVTNEETLSAALGKSTSEWLASQEGVFYTAVTYSPTIDTVDADEEE